MRLSRSRGLPAAAVATATAVLALLPVLPGLGLPAAQARDDTVYECSGIGADDLRVSDGSDSVPLSLLGVDRAQQVLADGRRSPEPVAVAVLDSGVSTASGLITVAESKSFAGHELQDPHGTEIAGLIAGHPRPGGKPVGVAPAARIVDVRVYDQDPPTTDGAVGVTTPALVEGLDWVAHNARRLHIEVANVSLAVTGDDALAAAVRRVREAGVLLVAASGNRPTEDTDPLIDRYGPDGSDVGPGEDAAGVVFPAGYPSVLAVNATAEGLAGAGDIKEYVLANRATDVAAPTYDAVSIGLNGSTCRIQQVATSFAAAEVSGVAALLRARFPHDTVDQTIARLMSTADGTLDDPTPFQGAGVVQPVEALTRPLHADRAGSVARNAAAENDNRRATAPEARADELSATRENAVWWGLLGGGALLLALLLRPVLARRRDQAM